MLGLALLFECAHQLIARFVQVIQVDLWQIYWWQLTLTIQANLTGDVLLQDHAPLVAVVIRSAADSKNTAC